MIKTMNGRKKIYIKTFGGFDVYVNERMIYFPNVKAKELLAYLVDQKGEEKDLLQISQTLYEDTNADDALNAARVSFHRLKKILEEYGVDYIILNVKKKNRRGVYKLIEDEVECDYYEFTNCQKFHFFHGAYMPEYSWAEYTQASLMNYFNRTSPKTVYG